MPGEKHEMKKKVLAITGIRSEYDILFPVIKMLDEDPGFELKLVVSGAHLSGWHGFTLNKILDDGFTIADRIDSLFMTNRKTQRVKGIGVLTTALAQTVEREQPDFLIVIGDREESIATGLVGNYMDVLVAHIGGGDPVYANADDPVRFAVTDLAHVHFTLASEYGENLKKIGEEEFRVFNSGNPSLDHIRATPDVKFEKVREFLEFDVEPGRYIVLIFHPLSSEIEDAYRQMSVTLSSISEFCKKHDFKTVGLFPATDPGAYDVIKAIEEFRDDPRIRFYKYIPHDIFVNLNRNAQCLAGNSSMGVLEAPYYRLPAVNIGRRQSGRLNAGNLEFVDFDKPAIIKSLEKACNDDFHRKFVAGLKNPYGDGTAARKIRDALASIDLNDKKWYVKRKLF